MPVNAGGILGALLLKDTSISLEEEITGMAYHTDDIKPGCLFFALPGTRYHGWKYALQAVEKGARAVVVDRDAPEMQLPLVRVPDVRLALAVAAEVFYGQPSSKIRILGVTGTNGKTTTTHLINSILEHAGYSTGMLGTLQYRIGQERIPPVATTPEASDLQHLLCCMAEREINYGVLEVSSHALEWKRVTGIDFDVAVLTNITGDHLDFHGDFDSYLAAKTSLFARMGSSFLGQGKPRAAVLNSDDNSFEHIRRMAVPQVVTYGINEFSDVAVSRVQVDRERTEFKVDTFAGSTDISLKLRGKFNVYNAAAATAAALVEGIDLQLVKEALEQVEGIPGRFEKVEAGQDFTVLVDYAHTADGLKNVLQTARGLLRGGGRLITVFGCGGDRDSEKRPLMGGIAGRYSDICIITSDNPRSEEPASIIKEVVPGVAEILDCNFYREVADREKAIWEAIEIAKMEDVVLIAGKGHEETQVFKDRVVPFSDREVARKAVESMKN